jgi:hypothetical protein
MKIDANIVYRTAKAYKPPLPGWLMRIVNAIAGVVSGYGSGYFFYWIFTIDAVIRYDFDYANPHWYLGMVIGMLISMDIYIAKFKFGQKIAESKLYGDAVNVNGVADIVDSLKRLIGPLRIAARYTTVIGFAALLFGKIDFMFQADSVADQTISMKESRLEQIEEHPLPAFDQTPTYSALASLFHDGLDNDDSVRVELNKKEAEYNRRRTEIEQEAATLRAEITSLRSSTVRVNNTALFDFFGELWNIQSVLLIIISTLIAGVVVDQVFGVSSQEVGEYVTFSAVSDAFNPVNDVNSPFVNPASSVNVSGKTRKPGMTAEVGNSYGVDFGNRQNQLILEAIKTQYHRIKPDGSGKRVSFADIGNMPHIDRSRQYVHTVKDAAIEEGLLPADFMNQFKEAV